MRISDWSSDVCSSDLHQLALAFAFSLLPIVLVYNITHYYTLMFTQGVKIISLLSDPFGWGWNLFGTAGLLRAPILPSMSMVWHTQEIGSASCRERVCQYGWSPGGAGSLKKKKNKKT